jgi:hypothetical protein
VLRKWDAGKIEGRDVHSVGLRAVRHIRGSSRDACRAPKVMWKEPNRSGVFIQIRRSEPGSQLLLTTMRVLFVSGNTVQRYGAVSSKSRLRTNASSDFE